MHVASHIYTYVDVHALYWLAILDSYIGYYIRACYVHTYRDLCSLLSDNGRLQKEELLPAS